MAYPLVARPLRVKISELIGDIPALLVHKFLDLDAVMPPERLRWSRALGRPCMSVADDDNIVGPVWITEVLDEDAKVGGNCVERDRIVFMCRSMSRLPPRCHLVVLPPRPRPRASGGPVPTDRQPAEARSAGVQPGFSRQFAWADGG